jgi:hypothetical protein
MAAAVDVLKNDGSHNENVAKKFEKFMLSAVEIVDQAEDFPGS